MFKDNELFHKITDNMDLYGEPIPGLSLVEIIDDCRVLFERHLGVSEYSPTRITIKVKFGFIVVCGAEMYMRKMTRNQLVICGKICSITLKRRTPCV